jgi:Fe-S-cluster containining protein
MAVANVSPPSQKSGTPLTNTASSPTAGATVISMNPCLDCGACCATFRCSFYWAEADDAPGGTVPVALTEQITPFRRARLGMSGAKPRCIALEGEIGVRVSCSIYPLRSSVCRAFPYSGQDGRANERCEQARTRWGLPPLFTLDPKPTPVDPPDTPPGDCPMAA